MQFWDKGIQLVDGCSKVSPGCKNCWSEAMTARFKRVPDVLTDGRFNGHVKFNLHLLEKAAKVKKPHVYAIWNDLYHEKISLMQLTNAFHTMNKAEHHTFLVVTKRPEKFFYPVSSMKFPPHIWHIVTCEDQEQADKRIPHLLRIPGKRGIIIEPMLGTISFDHICIDASTENNQGDVRSWSDIDQVILGPENGPGKRPFNESWAESVKQQCKAAGVPFYRKDTEEGALVWRP
jgi:protein gp37